MVLARRVIMSGSVGVSSKVGDIGCGSSGISTGDSWVVSDAGIPVTTAAGTSPPEAVP